MGGHKIPISPHELHARPGASLLVVDLRRAVDRCGSERLIDGGCLRLSDHLEHGARPADYVGAFMAAINRPAAQHFHDGASS